MESASNVHYNILILEKGYKAAEILNRYDSQTLDSICREFLIYTAEDKIKKSVTQKIAQIVKSQEKA